MWKDKLTICLFAALTAAVPVLSALDEGDILFFERRLKSPFPSPVKNGKLNADWAADMDAALADRFPGRRKLLQAGSWIRDNIAGMADENGVYLEDGYLFRMGTLAESTVRRNIRFLSGIAERFSGERCFAIVPRKNDYAGRGRPDYSYSEMEKLAAEEWEFTEISLLDCLTLQDYYRTDIHWRQECLEKTVSVLLSAMGKPVPEHDWTEHSHTPFYGALCAWRSAPEPDTLVWLTDGTTSRAAVYSLEKGGMTGVYDPAALSSPDAYNVFLDGPSAFLRIENPDGPAGSRLTVFRDSFASSLLPWLISSYETIDVIDLRYYSASLLDALDLDFGGDVLFLYGQEVLNTDGFRK